MKRAVFMGFLLAIFVCLSTSAMADTFIPGSSGVNYAINDGSDFFTNSAGYNTGDVQSYNAGSYFYLTTAASGYSDAGIVLYFNGGLKLGDLLNISADYTGASLYVNLWLDTSGDGSFFEYDGDHYLSLNGDSYFGGAPFGSGIDENSVFQGWGGLGQGGNYTLAQLQAGEVAGIDADTLLAIYIGFSGENTTANISSLTAEVVPLPGTLLLLGSGLLGLGLLGGRRKKV
jgi:hypothetical protein